MTSSRGRVSVTSQRIASSSGDLHAYWDTSRRPLHILVFLLPLLAVYHLGLVAMSGGSGGSPGEPQVLNLAHIRMLEFFDLFGSSPRTGLTSADSRL